MSQRRPDGSQMSKTSAVEPSQSHPFDESLHLQPTSDGRITGSIDTRWWLFVGPNGGFLASLCLQSLQHAVGNQAHPRSFSIQFLRRVAEGPVEFDAQVDKQGQTFLFASGRMYQNGNLLSTFVGAFSAPQSGPAFYDHRMPSVKQPEDIPPRDLDPDGALEFSQHFEFRPALDAMPFSGRDSARIGGWIRFKKPRPIDALQIPTIADSLFPAVYVKLEAPVNTPTIDLTVHFRSTLPRDYDWLLACFETRYAIEGFIEEDGEIWARDGTLIAQSRQLAVIREL